jgi:hypothetical protein
MQYIGKTIIQIAQERGSASKTKAGAWKYLLAHLPQPARPRCSSAYDHEIYADNRWHRRADGRARVLGYYVGYYDPATPGNIQLRLDREARQREEDRHYTIIRSPYGELIRARGARAEEPPADLALFAAAQALVQAAASAGVIERNYDTISWDHRGRAEGEALHHDLYDAAPGAAIVCLRRTIGSKYGVSTKSKIYVLLTESTEGEHAAQTLTVAVAKYANRATQLGEVIAHVRGERKISLAPPPADGYKALALDEQGRYRSVWDGSEWPVGQPRIERAQREHAGGLYYYRNLDQLIMAAQHSAIFGKALTHRRLAIVAVRAEGQQIQYDSGKYAATRLTIIEQIGSIL